MQIDFENNEVARPPVAGFSVAVLGAAAGWRWLDENFCRVWLLEQFYPTGPCCAICREPVRPGRVFRSWWQLKRIRCHACGKFYKASKNTILHNCALDLRQVVMLAWAYSLGLTNVTAAGLAGTDKTTARNWRLRLAALNSD
ncbi:hypothetical protein KAI46_05215 [bacterium]|nr:hypothetical protein [bacterium]